MITVLLVEFRQGVGIEKDCGSSLKSNPMLTSILSSFDRIPLKSIPKWFGHEAIIS